ncbi:hypothetical protein BJX63DRAFT_426833 [Aspergillus granulosus]|uniref:DUF6546 domain-containing protein n=1 Tax=Aspergillus granulosus TaxID=176169 RepID=A0ABR4I5I1_9EURO
MDDFYRAAGTAAQFMPKLELMVLQAQLYTSPPSDPDGVIVQAGHWFMYDRFQMYATWAGSGEFHPADDVRETWKAVGRNHGIPNLCLQNEGYLICEEALYYQDQPFDEEWKRLHRYNSWDN